jgi:hypothetical protein
MSNNFILPVPSRSKLTNKSEENSADPSNLKMAQLSAGLIVREPPNLLGARVPVEPRANVLVNRQEPTVHAPLPPQISPILSVTSPEPLHLETEVQEEGISKLIGVYSDQVAVIDICFPSV